MSSLIQESKANSDLGDQKPDVELQEKSLQLQKQVFESQEKYYKLKLGSLELKEKIVLEKNINFNSKVYFCYGDAKPFCPHCFKKQSLLIYLTGPRQIETGYIYNCPVCKREY